MEGPAAPPGAVGASAAGDVRRRKEAFVAGLPGTTKWEIFCVAGIMPMCSFLCAWGRGGGGAQRGGGRGRRRGARRDCRGGARARCPPPPPPSLHPHRPPTPPARRPTRPPRPALRHAAAAAQAWALPRLRALGAPPAAQRAALAVLDFAAIVGPQVALTMSGADAVPVFLILLLVWVSTALKAWLRLLRGPGARAAVAAVAQHLAEPRQRCARGSAARGPTRHGTAARPRRRPRSHALLLL
jgi:hypothetical protein